MPAAAGNIQFSSGTMSAPAMDAFVITPSDSLNFNTICRMVYVGVAGDISLVTAMGTTVLFKAVPVGILNVMALRINATGTLATTMLALV